MYNIIMVKLPKLGDAPKSYSEYFNGVGEWYLACPRNCDLEKLLLAHLSDLRYLATGPTMWTRPQIGKHPFTPTFESKNLPDAQSLIDKFQSEISWALLLTQNLSEPKI